MNRAKIRSLIALLSAALIGLIFIQVHWIGHAVEEQEKRFVENVNLALAKVPGKLYQQHIVNAKDSNQTADLIDLLLKNMSPKKLMDQIGMSISISTDDSTITLTDNSQPLMPPFFGPKQNRAIGAKFSQENVKSTMNLFRSLLETPKKEMMMRQLDAESVNKAINESLAEQGISTDYNFAVYDNFSGTALFGGVDSEKMNRKLLESRFGIDLTAGNFMLARKALKLFFPSAKSYVLRSIYWLFALAIILLSIIIYVFYTTISTIFRMKKLSEVRDDFINNMTHELKTPISTISLACEMLTDSDVQRNQQQQDKYVQMIDDENNRLGLLVENVLTTALIDRGALKLKLDFVDLHSVIESVLDNIRIQIESRGGEIVVQHNASNFSVHADKTHLTNVINNLVDNANKYSPDKPEIQIKTENVNGSIKISVIDKGVGINKENRRKIFDALYRIPTGNVHNTKGFGIGLSYVKAIMDLHGGTVDVQSEVGKGSCFSVTLLNYENSRLDS